MKTKYAFILAGGLLLSTGLYSCTSENTTGVETDGTTNNAVDGRSNNAAGGTETTENISPLDTAQNAGSGNMNDTTRNSGTTSPTGSQ
ncbi:hypothetical protein [Pontibacter akesuensis]|uniref:Uncharacterized protein n=1 Tax=Pontibacter akesuensis TaxID=388950 RepID=A0A1I7IGH0_9BACT|nr:hypothetical protein [Pontibacter akesuensis]GHA67064.1 hypothetical protein GCM10007389_20240 [Pontibacter akesuensis]SFU72029.1 hypothetical protein SAMN04487941_2195 [Pontibacter akesuensis]